MTPGERLQRSIVIAEDARVLPLKNLVGELLIFGRVEDGEVFNARCVVATWPVEVCDLGVVGARHSRVRDWLETSLSGWSVARVAHGKRLVAPKAGDVTLARERLRALGLVVSA